MELTSMIKEMQNIYDLLALCCSYIFNEIEDEPYDFAAFNDELYIDVYVRAFREFRNFLYHFMEGNSTVEKCYAVVKYIDEKIEYEFRYNIVNKKDILEYEGLNGQFKDRVRILLKNAGSYVDKGNAAYKKVTKDKYNLLRDSHDCPCSKIDAVTRRYMIWDKVSLDKYPVRVYRLKEAHYINRHFEDRHKLVFAVIPFTDESIKSILVEKRVNKAFYIENMKQDAEVRLKEKYRAAYKGVINKDVDFMIYPEMLMTDEIRTGCRFDRNGPKVIVNGSVSKNKVNKSVVCAWDGEELFSYCKKNPYKYEEAGTEYTEWLDQKENAGYSILEIPELGRVSVAICKDLWSNEVIMFHKMIQTKLLIVPAYTASGDLESSARNLSEEYNCVVVLANSCSALSRKQQGGRIGFVTLPAKILGKRTAEVEYYEMSACQKECSKRCKGKLITIEFAGQQYDSQNCGYNIRCEEIN